MRAQRRAGWLGLVAVVIGLFPMLTSSSQASLCFSRTLVVSAYPSEADAILTHVKLDERSSIVLKDHHYYLGSIEGRPVVTTMTGIGFVNAMQTTKTAIEGFTCHANGSTINAVVFSGVAGGAGRTQVADVAAPSRWTVNDGKSWTSVDPRMLAVARKIKPTFTSVNTAGDPLCTCQDPDLVPLIDLKRTPKLYVGGDGSSADTNSHSEAQLCLPGGGDVFGCEPCHAPDRAVDPVATVTTFPAFFSNLIRSNASGTTSASGRTYDAVDQETGAVQQVAKAKKVPFLAFRGMSDGPGDPLGLPGFPFQFFFYKQIAAENAASATAAFLKAWH